MASTGEDRHIWRDSCVDTGPLACPWPSVVLWAESLERKRSFVMVQGIEGADVMLAGRPPAARSAT